MLGKEDMQVGEKVCCEMWGIVFTKAWNHDDDGRMDK